MNKNFLSYLLVGALCLSACSDKDNEANDLGVTAPDNSVTTDTPTSDKSQWVITAGFAENHDNANSSTQKSYIEGDVATTKFKYNFHKGDEVVLEWYFGSNYMEYITFKNSSKDGNSASFVTDENPGNWRNYRAYLPAKNYIWSNKSYNFPYLSIPNEQTAVEDTYDPEAVAFVSFSDVLPTEFSFRTVNSFLLIANGADYEFSKIELRGNNGETLAGVFNCNQSNYRIELEESKSTTITLNGTIKTNSNYFIALAPCAMDLGYTLLGYCADGSVYEYKVEKTVEFKRNQIRGVKPKWEKYELVLNKSLMQSAIPSDKATSITFGKKSEYSDVSLVDYADDAKLIGVYTSTTDPSVFYVLSENDGEIMAPESCWNLFGDYSVLKTLSLNNFNTANVTDMQDMFYGCSGLTNLTFGDNFKTANVMYMQSMFLDCSALTSLDLGDNFNTSNVENMSYMFYSCLNLKAIYVTDKFTTDKVTKSYSMFYGCTSLVGGMGTKYNSSNTDGTYAKFDGGASAPGYFSVKGVNLSVDPENKVDVNAWK